MIGVLTKPDTIQSGEEEAWLRILNGSRHTLKRKYDLIFLPKSDLNVIQP
jgi:hypothetical protein